MAKIGILGGTFDPVHNGHIACAEQIRDEFGLDRVLFVLSANPPHKFASDVTPARLRARMIELALEGHEGLCLCDLELRRPGYSYSADTIAELLETYPDDGFYYIIGTDAAVRLPDWKNVEALTAGCSFILVKRPGDSPEIAEKALAALEKAGAKYFISRSENLADVSSTSIREAVREAGNVCEELPEKGLVPEAVCRFIGKNNLYKGLPWTEEMIVADLRSVLKPGRFVHSLGVAEEAERLAEKYGVDRKKARLAGLLHDCGKNVSEGQLVWIGMTKNDFAAVPGGNVNVRVIHGPVGAIVAERRYGVTDPEVLSAIAKHTTGAAEMTLLDKIIFLADYTEKNRKGELFDNVRRVLDRRGPDAAIRYSCDETIKLILKRGEQIDIRTVEARNSALELENKADAPQI